MILLTFNLRSFQVPTEKQGLFTMKELDEVSVKGVQGLLRILENAEIQATFFIESHFAERNPELIKSIAAKNFGIAHWYTEENTDQLAESKKILQEISGKKIFGIRYAPHCDVSADDLKKLDYVYDASFEPRDISQYLKKITRKTTHYVKDDIMYLPVSQSPMTRLPFSDFSFQFLPLRYYEGMVLETVNQDEYTLLYYYPWQFMNVKSPDYGLPFYRKYNLGDKMYHKFSEFLKWINENDFATATLKEYFF
ncbi:polysaccharide deacetylase [Elizabethkingia anophelis]|uniref:polysaccharide deacetylase family protein n=1 Tax=Elizabethkingia anophelis TaxID=1117645 RepID=UPI0038917D38|nr:polysaccharide deacetylase [Elizabethkingia anophelis]MCT4144678.1 polysaccharide deacetylase [Elizabethkingia anophelis]